MSENLQTGVESNAGNDLITLAIPVYNAENYIERSLKSALNQTYKNIEILIVDDCGTDRSIEIVNQFVNENRGGGIKIRVVRPSENIGVGAARTLAIKEAKGKYLFYMDQDDELMPFAISVLYKEMCLKEVDVVQGSYAGYKNGIITYTFSKQFHTVNRKGSIKSYFRGNLNDLVWNKLYNVKFLRDNNIETEARSYEDIIMVYQVALNAEAISSLSLITYKKHDNPNSLGATNIRNLSAYSALVYTLHFKSLYLKSCNFDYSLRVLIKNYLFSNRLLESYGLSKSPESVHYLLPEALSSKYLLDKDTFTNPVLFVFWLFSILPYPIKMLGVRFYIFLRRFYK